MPRTSARRSTYHHDIASGETMSAAGSSRGGNTRKNDYARDSKAAEGSRGGGRAHMFDDSRSADDSFLHDARPSPPRSKNVSQSAGGKTPRRSVRKERRFEDFVSDEGDSSADGSEDLSIVGDWRRTSPRIARQEPHSAEIDPLARGAKAAGTISDSRSHRQPRQTYYEEAGDDGFIFSAADPSSSRSKKQSIPEAKGRPPVQAPPGPVETSREDDDVPFRPRSIVSTPGPARTHDGHRVTSGSVKASRRTSLLRDGGPAYPHPTISDADLYRHCSSELDSRERMRHMASWTLERGTSDALAYLKKHIGRSAASKSSTQSAALAEAHGTLQAALQKTLRDLSRGALDIDWSKRGASSSAVEPGPSTQKPHPRNEVNRRTAAQLERTVATMERELEAWQRTKEETDEYAAETARLEAEIPTAQDGEEADVEDDGALASLLAVAPGKRRLDKTQEEQLRDATSALANEAPWLLSLHDVAPTLQRAIAAASDVTHGSDLSGKARAIIDHAKKRQRRDRSSPPPSASDDDGTDDVQDVEVQETFGGSALDTRWKEVEFHTDLLREQAHAHAQLCLLAQRYTSSVSARGAQAIGELVSGAPPPTAAVGRRGGRGSGKATSSSPSSTSSPSSAAAAAVISQENRRNLERILAGIRSLEDGGEALGDSQHASGLGGEAKSASTAAAAHGGDVSDSDILRAFAGVNHR